MSRIKLLIVDDHPLVRHGLRRILEREKDIEVVGEAENGQQAIEDARRLRPQVILMDINLPIVNGLQAAREIKHSNPEMAVVTLTAYNNTAQLFHAMRSGASVYYPKEVAPSELLRGIRTAVEGNYIVEGNILTPKQLDSWLMQQLSMMSANSTYFPEELFVPLSSREMEILQQIARGLSNKEIAKQLGISRQTVKNHMTSILRKLSVNDRTQAALYALRHGWIRLEDTE